MKKLFSRTILNWIILISTILIPTILLLQPGLPSGHDTYAHATYSKIFIHSLTQGQFPVRWVEHAWIGYGQPIFNYYQVGYFYLVSLFNLVFPTLTGAIKASVLFLWLMGGGFTYLFTKKYGRQAALVASFIYILSPYLLLDIFVRSSFPEFTALSLIPGIFWAVDQLIHTKRPLYISVLAFLLAATFISHLPTVVLFAPLITLYTLFTLYETRSSIRIFSYLSIAVILGISMSAFYVLPAITELNLIQIEKLQTGQFNFSVNFVEPSNIFSYIWGYSGEWWGTHSPFSYLIGITPWLIIAASLSYFVITAIKYRKVSIQLLFWLLCIAYACFFIHKISEPIWKAIPIFNFFQFPWRFFMLIPISTAVLSAILLNKIHNLRHQTMVTIILFIITTISIVPFIASQQFLSIVYFNLPFKQWRQHPEAQYVAFWEPGYSPEGTSYVPQKNEFQSIWSLTGEGTVTEQSIKLHQIIVGIQAESQSTLTINTPYYPYWQAKLNDQPVPITSADPYHFMNINIPPGNHNIAIQFQSPKQTVIAQVVSLITICTITILLFQQLAVKSIVKKIKK